MVDSQEKEKKYMYKIHTNKWKLEMTSDTAHQNKEEYTSEKNQDRPRRG